MLINRFITANFIHRPFYIFLVNGQYLLLLYDSATRHMCDVSHVEQAGRNCAGLILDHDSKSNIFQDSLRVVKLGVTRLYLVMRFSLHDGSI